MHKALGGANPFPHKGHRVMKGKHQTHLKPSKIKHSRSGNLVNSFVKTDLVKGPLKASGKRRTSHKRTATKA